MTSDERFLLECLQRGPLTVSQLCSLASLSEGRAYYALRGLEIGGLVRRLPGNIWETVPKKP